MILRDAGKSFGHMISLEQTNHRDKIVREMPSVEKGPVEPMKQ